MLTKDYQSLKSNRGEMEDSFQVSGSGMVCGFLHRGGRLGRALAGCEAIHQCAVYHVRSVWRSGSRWLWCLPNALSPRREEGLDVQK